MKNRLVLPYVFFSIVSILIIAVSVANIRNISIYLLLFWVLLILLCESLPVFISKERAVSVTLAILIASQLSHGTYFTTIAGAICFLFIFTKYPNEGYKYIFTISPKITIGNIINYTITLFISGMLYDLLLAQYPILGENTFNIIPILVFTSTFFLLNSIILTFFITLLNAVKFIPTWKQGVLWALPNFIAIAPIGFFIHRLYMLPSGYFYILLLLGPLLLARYSFKLYLDSQSQYYKTVKTLTVAIEAKDEYTEGHSRRVEYYAEKIATRMKLSSKKIESIKVAALLHDIGKIGIDDSILRKPEKLDDDEWVKIQQHPSIGAKILEDVPFPDKIKDYIEHHHEKYNGTGYPDKLRAGDIPIEACILTAADAYDAMTSDRPYRSAMSRATAMENLRKDRGTHFHPVVADVLLQILEEEAREEQKAAARAEQEAAYQQAAPTVEH